MRATSEMDDMVVALEAVEAERNRYRQAVYRLMCPGELCPGWQDILVAARERSGRFEELVDARVRQIEELSADARLTYYRCEGCTSYGDGRCARHSESRAPECWCCDWTDLREAGVP